MGKGMKVFLIVCGITISVGLLLGTLGLALGGIKGFKAVENRVPWVSLGVPGHQTSDSHIYDSFSSMDIESDMGKIQLIEGDEYKVEVTYDKRSEPEIQVENDTLTITCNERRSGWFNLDFFGGWNAKGASFKVYYPKGAVFEDIKVNSDLGDVRLSNLAAKQLKVEANMGNVVLNQVKADTLTAKLDLGNLEGSNLITKGLDANLNAGRLDMKGAFYGVTKAYCDLGDCIITTSVPKNEYTFITSVDLGSCKIDGTSTSAGYALENSDAKNKMDLKCDMGSIRVNFN